MSAELDGAKANAQHVAKVGFPLSNDVALANAMLLIIQHLEKRESD
jgi:hypothetical protein